MLFNAFHCCCCFIAENVSLNAGNVSALDRQNLSPYSAGPCECLVPGYIDNELLRVCNLLCKGHVHVKWLGYHYANSQFL